ncbi:MAG: peptidylprolyl isomerase [Pseudomonadota bacterium]
MSEKAMKLTQGRIKIIVPILLLLAFLLGQITQVSAFSVRQLLGLDSADEETAEKTTEKTTADQNNMQQQANKEWAKPEGDAGQNPQLSQQYITLLINNMGAAERQQVLADAAVFKQVIENEAANRAIMSAAIANKMDKNQNVEFLMRRGAENILREAYLNRLIASKLPADFPNSEQISEYYQANQTSFVISERLQVWQIFFAKPVDADAKKLKEVRNKAGSVLEELQKNKSKFAELANEHSEHVQSRVNGGYMGLIKSGDLLPAVKEPLLNLKQEQLSQVVESEAGFHIMKRGELMPEESVSLDQVEPQIKKLLIDQAKIQLTKAVYSQAQKEFPQKVPEEKIEEWRLRLKTNTVQQ